jgi:hypothetical protein
MTMLVEHINNTLEYVALGIHADLSSSVPFKRRLPTFLSTVLFSQLDRKNSKSAKGREDQRPQSQLDKLKAGCCSTM